MDLKRRVLKLVAGKEIDLGGNSAKVCVINIEIQTMGTSRWVVFVGKDYSSVCLNDNGQFFFAKKERSGWVSVGAPVATSVVKIGGAPFKEVLGRELRD